MSALKQYRAMIAEGYPDTNITVAALAAQAIRELTDESAALARETERAAREIENWKHLREENRRLREENAALHEKMGEALARADANADYSVYVVPGRQHLLKCMEDLKDDPSVRDGDRIRLAGAGDEYELRSGMWTPL